MKAFFDTSVLIATFYANHEHHGPSLDLFVAHNKKTGGMAAHSLAEVYSVLTGMPGKNRVSPDEALLFLENVRERLSIIALEASEYLTALQAASRTGVTGGSVYDAMAAYTAGKAGAVCLYTWNVKHFGRLAPRLVQQVKTP